VCKCSLSDAESGKNLSENLFSIRRADDLADSVEGLSQRHGDKFRVNPGPEFFCSLAQAGLGTLKARLMPRVDCGQHWSVSGAISAGFGHDQIYEKVNSLAGPAGNCRRSTLRELFRGCAGIEKIDFV
jgi:hypothetical protein